MDASAFSLSKAKLRTLFSSPPNRFRSMLKESERSSISGTTTRSCMMALCLSGCRRRILPPLDELAWVARTGAEYGHLASWHIYTFVQALHGSQHLQFSCGELIQNLLSVLCVGRKPHHRGAWTHFPYDRRVRVYKVGSIVIIRIGNIKVVGSVGIGYIAFWYINQCVFQISFFLESVIDDFSEGIELVGRLVDDALAFQQKSSKNIIVLCESS